MISLGFMLALLALKS